MSLSGPSPVIEMRKYIIISRGAEFLRVPADKLVYISAEGNYSNVCTSDGKVRLVTYQLGQIEDLIAGQMGEEEMNFLRLGRKLIVNINYIHFIDVTSQTLILSDCDKCYYELTASREVLIKLKAYVESMVNINNEYA